MRYPQEVGIAFDQLINALIPPVLTLSFSDETLSARTFRAARRGRLVGRLAMPVIDFLFRWQGVKNHCEMAYIKEKERRGLPPEYRDTPTSTP
jgi:hypothetical protein